MFRNINVTACGRACIVVKNSPSVFGRNGARGMYNKDNGNEHFAVVIFLLHACTTLF